MSKVYMSVLLIALLALAAVPAMAASADANVNLTIETYASASIDGPIEVVVSNGHSGSGSTSAHVEANVAASASTTIVAGGASGGTWTCAQCATLDAFVGSAAADGTVTASVADLDLAAPQASTYDTTLTLTVTP